MREQLTTRAAFRRASALSATMLLLAACATPMPSRQHDLGVLVMAHGGSKQWNSEVLAAIEPLKSRYNVEVAFGMADAASLQEGVLRLEERGARRIGVVRMFISGESFLERTEQVLGLSPGAPPRPTTMSDHAGHAGHSMEFWRIDTRSAFALSEQGLVEAPEMGAVLAERARALSREPRREDVLILAHGPEDDAENERWLTHLEARADDVRHALPFRSVRVETLREDWPEKRKDAEQRIRDFVSQAVQRGDRAMVIPFRVQGFGPYAKVLEGLEYVSDGRGLIPSDGITQWLAHRIDTLQTAQYRPTVID
jgi:sirohydrochlorin cobaltochelatase